MFLLADGCGDSPDNPGSGEPLEANNTGEVTQDDNGCVADTPPPLPSVSPPNAATSEKDTATRNWQPLTFRIKL